jgi:exodeoxyribonuclease VII large subunit
MTKSSEIKTKKPRASKKKSAPAADLFSFASTASSSEPYENPAAAAIEDEQIVEQVLGVHDYLDYISHIVQMAKDIKVLGEISRVSHHQTGVYITLKDKENDSVLNCYVNPYTYKGLGLLLEDGMEVKLTGVPNIFKRRSELSLRVENIELTGEGALKKQYDMLKMKLEKEGLFDRKREIPEFISSVGIITSRTGAVISDFRTNIGKLGYKLYLKDCRVEGAQAASQITKAIQYFNLAMPELDCLVVMRGGGSLEDLQAFNNEVVVREMFASKIPIICAIGHDRDVPLAQMVADDAQSTPTAVANRITQSWSRLYEELPQLERDIKYGFQNQLTEARRSIENSGHRLRGKMEGLIEKYNQLRTIVVRGNALIIGRIQQIKIDTTRLGKMIHQAGKDAISNATRRIDTLAKQIEHANPERQLKLGYSIVRNKANKVVRAVNEINTGDSVTIDLHKGSFTSTVTSK